MNEPRTSSTGSSIPPMRLIILALAVATAVIHVVLAMEMTLIPFYLNAVGYVVLAAALVLPGLVRHRPLIRWVLIGYTALTIVLWVVRGQPYTTIGYIDKALEIVLIGLLILDARRDTRAS